MKLQGKNILVTGGVGFVGGHLVEKLLELKANIIVVDITLDKKSYLFASGLHKKCRVIKLDICDYKKLSTLIKKNKIDFIFHLAAQALVAEAYKKPKHTLENNIISTINILEAVRTIPQIKGVIVASSDKCYGKLNKKKYVETDPLSGDHPYDTSKSATDLICSTYYSTYKTPVVITRFGNIYGEGDSNFSRIIPGVMKSIVTKKPLEIRSNGKYIRDYLYVKDVVAGYILLAVNIVAAKGQAYNFGSNDNLSVVEVIQTVEKAVKQKISYKILNTAANEIPYQSLNCSKIKKQFGWKQNYTIQNRALHILNWYKKF
ncbi:MAG: GDP-mannose 4,6-dehydratase [Candidatus Roizmanbacteria bacterium]|nr:GDP-mannose 4,6-dehydratase [Candidatus Roizmanbacteria bacterium]